MVDDIILVFYIKDDPWETIDKISLVVVWIGAEQETGKQVMTMSKNAHLCYECQIHEMKLKSIPLNWK